MRFKVCLQVDVSAYGNKLPIDYQYELSSLIYRMFEKVHTVFADQTLKTAQCAIGATGITASPTPTISLFGLKAIMNKWIIHLNRKIGLKNCTSYLKNHLLCTLNQNNRT
jgi:hypothetical protein